MLVDFTIKNFRSIKDEQLLSLVAEKKRDDIPGNLFCASENDDLFLLKSAVIYGANASGKSTILTAFKALQFLVLYSSDLKLDESIFSYEPFFLDVDSRTDSILFEMEFITNEPMRYRYSVEFNRKKILSEKLFFFPRIKGVKLYERDSDGDYSWGRDLKGKKQVIADEVLENTLFLSKAANRNDSDERIKNIYRYFKDSFHFYDKKTYMHKGNLFSETTRELFGDESGAFQSKLTGLLKSADFGISSIRKKVAPSSKENSESPEDFETKFEKAQFDTFQATAEFKHPVFKDGAKTTQNIYFDMEHESTGTIKMYDLAYQIITALEKGEVLFIDELDSSFHPLMSAYVFSLFNSPKHNPRNAQLIVTTHDVTLLDSEKLRRDQIWFTEKDAQGASSLYSLDEFKKSEVRPNIPFDKWYLSGRFSALPVIRESVFSEYMGDK